MGGSKSKPSTSTQAPATVWDPQANYLTDMYQQAQNMFGQQNANQSWQGDLANSASQYGQAGAGFNQGYGVLGQAAQGFQGLMNPGQNPMSDVYARMAGQQFNEQIMPGLKGDAMLGGGLGNSRAGIAQGLAGARMGQQLIDWNAGLYNQDANRQLQASQGMAGLGGMYGQLGGMQSGLGDAYAQLGAQRQQMPWQALQQYAGLLGRPTTLEGASSSTGATAGNSGAIGAIAPIAGAVLAPFTGGASLLAASAVSKGADSYYGVK